MGLHTDLDLGGVTLLVKDIKLGNLGPGQSSTIKQTIAGGATLTVTKAAHAGKIILLDTAAGTVITLPAALGTGDTYRFLVSVSVTTNNHIIKVANGTDVFVGTVIVSGNNATAVAGDVASSTDDTLTMNGTTTGGLIGSVIEVTDYVSGFWLITGLIAGSGSLTGVAFSATVS